MIKFILTFYVVFGFNNAHIWIWKILVASKILDCMLNLPILLQVYLGEQYVNNSTLSDVTFLVEGNKSVFTLNLLLCTSIAA